MRDYGTADWQGGDPACNHIDGGIVPRASTDPQIRASTLEGGKRTTTAQAEAHTFRDVCGKCGAQRVDAQLGLEATPAAYVAALVAVFAEVWRVLRADGTLWLNLGDSYAAGTGGQRTKAGSTARAGNTIMGVADHGYLKVAGLKPKDLVGVPWRVAFALQEAGWYLRSDIIWAKPNPMPESVTDRPTKAHEYVFLLSKQPRYFYDADAIREPHTKQPQTYLSNGIRAEREAEMRATFGEQRGNVIDRTRYSGGVQGNPGGRNARSVWEIATQPTPEAHFATFPEALVRRCIQAGSSERGGCAKCGAPWQRQVEREGGRRSDEYRDLPHNPKESGDGHLRNDFGSTSAGLARPGWRKNTPPETRSESWAASCACGAPPVPQVVLDPFVGSGTTALVARKHGRRATGIDLSADYLAIAARRLGQQSLFAQELGA